MNDLNKNARNSWPLNNMDLNCTVHLNVDFIKKYSPALYMYFLYDFLQHFFFSGSLYGKNIYNTYDTKYVLMDYFMGKASGQE